MRTLWLRFVQRFQTLWKTFPSKEDVLNGFMALLGWCIQGSVGETDFDTTLVSNMITTQDIENSNP